MKTARKPSRIRRMLRSTAAAAVLAAAPFLGSQTANAQGTLTVAMTAGDLPINTGTPDQGFEGFRFVGLIFTTV